MGTDFHYWYIICELPINKFKFKSIEHFIGIIHGLWYNLLLRVIVETSEPHFGFHHLRIPMLLSGSSTVKFIPLRTGHEWHTSNIGVRKWQRCVVSWRTKYLFEGWEYLLWFYLRRPFFLYPLSGSIGYGVRVLLVKSFHPTSKTEDRPLPVDTVLLSSDDKRSPVGRDPTKGMYIGIENR